MQNSRDTQTPRTKCFWITALSKHLGHNFKPGHCLSSIFVYTYMHLHFVKIWIRKMGGFACKFSYAYMGKHEHTFVPAKYRCVHLWGLKIRLLNGEPHWLRVALGTGISWRAEFVFLFAFIKQSNFCVFVPPHSGTIILKAESHHFTPFRTRENKIMVQYILVQLCTPQNKTKINAGLRTILRNFSPQR